MSRKTINKSFFVTLLALLLANCAADGGGETGTGFSTKGVITAFGSVFVNGVEYFTDSGTGYSLDGQDGNEDQLAIGMVVTIHGSVNADGITGQADHIEYLDEIQGVVLENFNNTSNSVNVMGQTVKVDANTVFKAADKTMMVTQLAVGHVVEVSGFSAGDGTILATRIELKAANYSDGDEIEVKGLIANLDEQTKHFNIGALDVDFSQVSSKHRPSTLSEGLYVKVASHQSVAIGMALIADEIELIKDGKISGGQSHENQEAELEGIVNKLISATSFEVNAQTVVINDNTQYENGNATDIVLNKRVSVYGRYNADGQLLADTVEFRYSDEGGEHSSSGDGGSGGTGTSDSQKFTGTIQEKNSTDKSITVGGDTYYFTNVTILVDNSDMENRHLSFADLQKGDSVEIYAYRDSTGKWLISKLERE